MNINYDQGPSVNPSLSSRIDDLTESLRDLRQFVTEFHDRLVGPQPPSPVDGKVNPMPTAQLDSMQIKLNGAQYNIDEIRGMIRAISGRI